MIFTSIWLSLGVSFSWSCGAILLVIAILIPLSPLININVHYVTMLEEKGPKYAIQNWKLPIILGVEQTKRAISSFVIEVFYEGEADPEVRKSKAEAAMKESEERAAEVKRRIERDRKFLLGEEE